MKCIVILVLPSGQPEVYKVDGRARIYESIDECQELCESETGHLAAGVIPVPWPFFDEAAPPNPMAS